MNINIITAQKEDLQEILDLQKACYLSEAELHNDFNIPPLTQTIESINGEFDNGWLFLKVVHNNTIIAAGRGIIDGDTAHIAKLTVKQEFQNQKIGQSLLKKIESKLSNSKRYELFTGHKSLRNIYLYEKLGYSEYKRQFINDNLTLVYLEKIN